MSLPRISIVTPSYNQADFLEQTIRSVLDQEGRGTLFELEYFVIDGGSTDASSDIIRKYASELSGWCSERDRGQTHAINKGMERCSGDILAYLNSDDYYLPGAFKRVVEAKRAFPDAELFHGICHKVDAKGNLIREQMSSIHQLSQILDLWEVWLRKSDNQNFIQPEVFWTRSLADKVGGFNEQLHYTMDFDYWLRAIDHGAKILPIQQPLAAFRIHGAQKTSQRDKSILELINVTTPYLQRTDDERITPSDRRRMIALNDLNRRMIENESLSPIRRLHLLVQLALEHKHLATSAHYWRHLRRTTKTLFVSKIK
jgi:glycosyltransferase involved in cell wall biosynthesis